MGIDYTSSVTTRNIYEGVYQIINNDFVYSYLVVGKEKALLIDTGWGTSDLKALVESITQLPLLVVNTHGHIDHVYGNYQFESIYILDEDVPMMKSEYTPGRRASILNRYDKSHLPGGITEESWVNAEIKNIVSLNNIGEFDLGGRVVDVIRTPGHTLGCVCFLDRNERLLFTGDSVIEGANMLQFKISAKLSTYINSLNILISKMPYFDVIFPAHGNIFLEPRFLIELKDAAEKILSGELTGRKHTVLKRDCLICKVGNFSILYKNDSI